MKPRRIMMTTDAVGGVWVYATALTRGLIQQGVEVTLVTLGPPPQGAKLDVARALSRRTNLVVTDLALEWLDPEGADAARARSTLLRIADQAEPDLVHLNGFREAATSWPCPALVIAHSCVWSWWKAARGDWPAERRWSIYRDAVAAGLNAAAAWGAPTTAFRDTIQRLYQPAAPGWVIHNGIDVTAEAVGAKEPVILTAGRVWDEGKNLIGLAHIAGGLPWLVEIAGDRMATDTNCDLGNVRWLGELDHAQLQARMRRAAVYAAPAHYEPFGLGILEAAAAGCALVLSDVTSLRELWDGAALFVPSSDLDQLRQALLQVCTDEVLRARLQRAALARAKRYSLDCTLSDYLELYDTVQTMPLPGLRVGTEARP
jgi:glycosyltransferase involved in cell wall biosynthesis